MNKRASIVLSGLLSLFLVLAVEAAEESSSQQQVDAPPSGAQAAEKNAQQEKAPAKKSEDDTRSQHEVSGDEYLKRRRFNEALKEFDAAIALEPKSPKLHVKKGIALYGTGKFEEAVRLMDKAVQLLKEAKADKAELWWPLHHKGIAQGLSGDHEAAIKSFSESIELKPNHENYSGRARIYFQLGKPEQALVDVKAALRYDPHHRQLNALAGYLESQVETQKQSETFLKEIAAKKGAQVTDSGLIYFELKKGDGKSPSAKDIVKVHYHGTLPDGTVFDSSVDRGEPARFPLSAVIPCWTEGLQKMRVGGKARLICPAKIAYGQRGAGELIKPGATLVFEVELLAIE